MTSEERIKEIRRCDAFTSSIVMLTDVMWERELRAVGDREVFDDIREHVIPLLEAEADKVAC